ncbi:DinB family protein [Neobacillus niacini]|uniref:DinB family protein n=1 Tax=Neobacillus niacini TaxID=86668 RepID=UPI002862EE75|nr:DinB family protein [Neobacillus niacini]MDR7002068.1 putative damage-inducible protein DinB [Neobacillus niacini]
MQVSFFEYHLWANKLIYKHLKELPEEVCFQEIQSVFPTLYDTLFHLYQVDFVWLGAIKGDPFEKIVEEVNRLKEENLERSLEKLENSYFQLGNKFREFKNSLENLDAITTLHHPSFGTLTTSYEELFQHVANHGTYHRGNITAMLSQLGYKGVPTDYIFYLYENQK